MGGEEPALTVVLQEQGRAACFRLGRTFGGFAAWTDERDAKRGKVSCAPEDRQDDNLPLEKVCGRLKDHLVPHRPLLHHPRPPLLHALPLRPGQLARLHRVVRRLHQLGSQLRVGGSYTGKAGLLELQLVKEGVEHAGVALTRRHWLTWGSLKVDTAEPGFCKG